MTNRDFDMFEKVANVTSLVQKIIDTAKKKHFNVMSNITIFYLYCAQLSYQTVQG